MTFRFISKSKVNLLKSVTDSSLYSHQQIFSSYAGAHPFEEEHNIHDLPYGYELGDDPFEPQGQADYPWLLIFIGIISFVHFSHSHLRFDRKKTGEVLYHQRLTAF